MVKLKNEYTDKKNIKHTVNHSILPNPDSSVQEQIICELRDVFIKQAEKLTQKTV